MRFLYICAEIVTVYLLLLLAIGLLVWLLQGTGETATAVFLFAAVAAIPAAIRLTLYGTTSRQRHRRGTPFRPLALLWPVLATI
jgi:hypothetical protein